MKIFQLQKTQVIPVSLQKAWDFFSSPHNLPKITPTDMDFQILSEVPAKIYPGLIIQYKVKPFPLVATGWVTEITQVNAPRFFVDEQRFGPYSFWHHQHHFRPVDGGTEILDLVHYGLPLGFLGRFAHRLFVKHQLNAIFEYRGKALIERFGLPKDKNKFQRA